MSKESHLSRFGVESAEEDKAGKVKSLIEKEQEDDDHPVEIIEHKASSNSLQMAFEDDEVNFIDTKW